MPIALVALGILLLMHFTAPKVTRWMVVVPLLGMLFGTFVWSCTSLYLSIAKDIDIINKSAYLCFVVGATALAGVLVQKFDRPV